MGLFTRGKTLWLRYRDVDGKWRNESSGYHVGDEALAEQMLEQLEARIAAARSPSLVNGAGLLKLRDYAKRWQDGRKDIATWKDDQGRLDNHIIPALGHIPLLELRPRHIRDFVEALKKKKKLGNLDKNGKRIEIDELIAPRTVLHIYGTLRAMLNDAVAEEVIPSTPCILKDELPEKKDKNRTWRRTAVFTRDEVKTIISEHPKVPEDRRVMYAIMFLGATRFGEAAALTWRDYDTEATPLGKLVIERSYSSKTRKTKSTKTDNPREMPVHPTLAKILAEWKLGGFERVMQRKPQPDDLIVPSRENRPRNANHMLRRFHQDLIALKLRERRQHDTRRTFISIARTDGARPDILRWATHGPTGDIVDDYTTLPWSALCAEVAKLQLDVREGKLIPVREGKLIPFPLAATGTDDRVTTEPADSNGSRYTARYSGPSDCNEQSKWRSGRDLNPRPPA